MSYPDPVKECKVRQAMKQMVAKLDAATSNLSDRQIKKLIKEIRRAKKIFIMGAGRSGLVAKAFAMRLMHLGFNVYVVGETVTPSLESGDLVIAVTGSGSTKSIAEWAEIAKKMKARLATITANPESRISKISDAVVILPVKTKERAIKGYVERQLLGEHKSLTPLGTMFELTAMLFLDSVIAELMVMMEKSEEDLNGYIKTSNILMKDGRAKISDFGILKALRKGKTEIRSQRLEVPGGVVDHVHFSVTSPSTVRPADSFVVDVWAHLERQREEVIKRAREAAGSREICIKSKGPVEVARGSVLSVRLKIEELVIENSEDTILWDSKIGNATFSVKVPKNVSEGSKAGLATIHVEGLQIARIYFEIRVGRELSEVRNVTAQEVRNRKAFASYASADRDQVLARVQGMEKVAPQLQIFLDVISLRSGQYREQELEKIIPSNDVFYLFWSRNAAKSQWVDKEWRCALSTRGLDFIDPVPLVSPDEAPPPPELASKHFNDWVLAYIRGKKEVP